MSTFDQTLALFLLRECCFMGMSALWTNALSYLSDNDFSYYYSFFLFQQAVTGFSSPPSCTLASLCVVADNLICFYFLDIGGDLRGSDRRLICHSTTDTNLIKPLKSCNFTSLNTQNASLHHLSLSSKCITEKTQGLPDSRETSFRPPGPDWLSV